MAPAGRQGYRRNAHEAVAATTRSGCVGHRAQQVRGDRRAGERDRLKRGGERGRGGGAEITSPQVEVLPDVAPPPGLVEFDVEANAQAFVEELRRRPLPLALRDTADNSLLEQRQRELRGCVECCYRDRVPPNLDELQERLRIGNGDVSRNGCAWSLEELEGLLVVGARDAQTLVVEPPGGEGRPARVLLREVPDWFLGWVDCDAHAIEDEFTPDVWTDLQMFLETIASIDGGRLQLSASTASGGVSADILAHALQRHPEAPHSLRRLCLGEARRLVNLAIAEQTIAYDPLDGRHLMLLSPFLPRISAAAPAAGDGDEEIADYVDEEPQMLPWETLSVTALVSANADATASAGVAAELTPEAVEESRPPSISGADVDESVLLNKLLCSPAGSSAEVPHAQVAVPCEEMPKMPELQESTDRSAAARARAAAEAHAAAVGQWDMTHGAAWEDSQRSWPPQVVHDGGAYQWEASLGNLTAAGVAAALEGQAHLYGSCLGTSSSECQAWPALLPAYLPGVYSRWAFGQASALGLPPTAAPSLPEPLAKEPGRIYTTI
eukprot:TRINITY_DN2152_c1_g1_i1.p1 TRINITY_DN2152_c1_g1~~TRINITY_DN2152_c1_g1_i1.p1  ORF type:complete len:553 (-),score=123.26 TRINITY_DN2152_c1_g1_i1:89-1747(-)